MGFTELFAGAAAVALAGAYLKKQNQPVEYVKSGVDGRKYLVRHDVSLEGSTVHDEALRAADTLAELNVRTQTLIDHLTSRYPTDERVVNLSERYNPEALSEGGHNAGHTSYSVDKGRRIVMCLRSRSRDGSHGRLEDTNTLMYVLIHELTHLATDEVGHTDLFWDNLDWLKAQAHDIGVYRDVDFSAEPAGYCGMVIKTSRNGGRAAKENGGRGDGLER